MAAKKKKAGLEGLKDTTGGRQRDDREVIDRTSFDPLLVDAKNVLTAVCLLQSPEEVVQMRAVASLEEFGKKDPANLQLLSSLKIFQNILPILSHPDFVARRFALKLIGMLSSLEDFREEMLSMDNVLETFTDILKTENDAVLQEYASLTLSELSKEYQVASELLTVEDCLPTLFLRLISADPDIQKNCLEIMAHLLNDINGIEVFIESPCFEMKTILNMISSSYPVIQALVIEVLTLLTAWCRDSRVLMLFRDSMGAELVLNVLETRDYSDLHASAMDLMINVADCPQLCEYLHLSGCLERFIRILENCVDALVVEKILGVLARMSQSAKGQEALHSVEMDKKFNSYLEVQNENIQEAACLGIANLARHLQSLQTIVEVDPLKNLMGILCDTEKNIKLRTMAAYALNILSNADKRPAKALVESEDYKGLFTILTDNSNLSTELCQNVIQVFNGISLYDELRTDVISENFLSALMSCLPSDESCEKKDPSLQVDALECLSEYFVESETHYYFNELNGVGVLLQCLKSKFASVREWAGHLVAIASQTKEFVESFIRKDGLEWMLKEKNATYSMPSWQSAIDSIFANCLPAKFAYTGRLDFEDITQDGFYVSMNPRIKFVLLDYFFEKMISPVSPIYVANFNSPTPVSADTKSTESIDVKSHISAEVSQKENKPSQSPKNVQAGTSEKDKETLKKIMKGADRNSLEEYNWTGSLLSYPSVEYQDAENKSKEQIPVEKWIPDPYLSEYLENLRKKIVKEESPFEDMSWSCLHPRLICNRARIIAEFVDEEMSGPAVTNGCNSTFKAAHINEIKYYLGTNILPLGLIRIGDYLERAMLFKVLADRTGFPCALVRGPCGRAWIEISIPVINVDDLEPSIREQSKSNDLSLSQESGSSKTAKSDSQKSSGTQCTESVAEEEFWFPKIESGIFKGFPKEYLKPNAIVDLVNEPGKILSINSYEAKKYCGDFLF